MKKIFLATLLVIVLFAFKSINVTTNFSGKWHAETTNSTFDLNLSQTNDKLSGSHCSVQMNGSKIDCVLEDTDISLSGIVGNSSSVDVTFTSQISQKSGTARITKLNDTTIDWQIITKPQGEFQIPNHITLTKQ